MTSLEASYLLAFRWDLHCGGFLPLQNEDTFMKVLIL